MWCAFVYMYMSYDVCGIVVMYCITNFTAMFWLTVVTVYTLLMNYSYEYFLLLG